MIIYTNDYRRNLINYWRQFYPEWEIPTGYHVHHIIPVSCGGSHHPKNLIALHPDDHISIHRCRGDKIGDKFIYSIGSRTGNKLSKETKNKISKSKKGQKHTLESKLKMSKQRSGKNHWNYGKTWSEETKRKNSESNRLRRKLNPELFINPPTPKGRKHSEETKRKMSESRKKYWEQKKSMEK